MLHLPAWCYGILVLASLLPGALSLYVGYDSLTNLHAYPTINPPFPKSPIGPEWQSYFRVTDPLPNVTFPLSQSYAGNLPVDRKDHPNNTLYFWGFEKTPGSLTAPPDASNNEPWGIWLNGPTKDSGVRGHGTPGLQALFLENGPIRINGDYSASPNPHSWNNLADYFWMDQPAGSGLSTADFDSLPKTGDEIGEDFMNFLKNLVKVFPSLATRPLYLTGEKYAGFYIPYIMKTYFEMENPPVKVAKIAIGSGNYLPDYIQQHVSTTSIIETFPQTIDYNPETFKIFQHHAGLCGFQFDHSNFTYPQANKIHFGPMPLPQMFGTRDVEELTELLERSSDKYVRELTMTTGGYFDKRYGCLMFMLLRQYASNYTFPWNNTGSSDNFNFQTGDLSDATIASTRLPLDTAVFLNDPATRNAIHGPLSPEPYQGYSTLFPLPKHDETSVNILDDLATKLTAQGIDVVLYSATNDPHMPPITTEMTIQNTTFGGIRGFTRPPSTRWTDDQGNFAGIVHQERGWTYAVFYGAGQNVARNKPEAAYTFLREFILGSNKTGLVTSIQGKPATIGGEDPSLLVRGTLQAPPEITYGDAKNPSVYVAAPAKREAWNAFMSTVDISRREVSSGLPWTSNNALFLSGAAPASSTLMISTLLPLLIISTLFF